MVILMNKYEAPKKRLIRKTPPSIIKDGKAIFGSFENSFEDLNLLEVKGQCRCLPNFCNRLRLTEWEAFELDFKEGTIVCAVYRNMCLNGMGILVYHDKVANKIYSYRTLTMPTKVKMSNTLLESESYISLKKFELRIKNDFKNRRAKIIANIYNKANGRLKMDIDINQVSNSSVVSIPLGNNKPLYSEKALFKAKGLLSFNDKEYDIKDNSMAIIDDHKAYYPYKTHYDWLTTMGTIDYHGRRCSFGFNLTKNQSVDECCYNENNIWIDDEFHYLPPVDFIKNKDTWIIKDEYDYVNLEFKIANKFNMPMHALILDIKYLLPFGTINGYLRCSNGEKIILNNCIGIAEDKTTRL